MPGGPPVDPAQANEPRTSAEAIDRFVQFLGKYYDAVGASQSDSWYAGYAYPGTGTKIEVEVHDPTAALGSKRCDTLQPLANWLLSGRIRETVHAAGERSRRHRLKVMARRGLPEVAADRDACPVVSSNNELGVHAGGVVAGQVAEEFVPTARRASGSPNWMSRAGCLHRAQHCRCSTPLRDCSSRQRCRRIGSCACRQSDRAAAAR